jgi:hypothetical protein
MAVVGASLELLVILSVLAVLYLYRAGIMSDDSHDKALDRIASYLPTATVTAFQLILSSYTPNGCTLGEVRSYITSLPTAVIDGCRADRSTANSGSWWLCRPSCCGSRLLC